MELVLDISSSSPFMLVISLWTIFPRSSVIPSSSLLATILPASLSKYSATRTGRPRGLSNGETMLAQRELHGVGGSMIINLKTVEETRHAMTRGKQELIHGRRGEILAHLLGKAEKADLRKANRKALEKARTREMLMKTTWSGSEQLSPTRRTPMRTISRITRMRSMKERWATGMMTGPGPTHNGWKGPRALVKVHRRPRRIRRHRRLRRRLPRHQLA